MNKCLICNHFTENDKIFCSLECLQKKYGCSTKQYIHNIKLEYHHHYNKTYYKNNKYKINKKNLEYEKNPKRKKYIKKYFKNRLANDILFKLRRQTSSHIKTSILKNAHFKSKKCKYPFNTKKLKQHLQKTMPYGYTWNDYLNGKLHIDHKIPVSWFTNKEDFFKIGWNLNNLRLLPAEENYRKQARWAVVEDTVYWNYTEAIIKFKEIYHNTL